MNDDPRVQQLLDELLDSHATPEEVCGSCPELLPTVSNQWRQMRRLQADLDALFPPADEPTPRPPEEIALPRIPGYEVEAVLGRGGMGIVFRAKHLRLNRSVALKMALAGAYAGPRERRRFQQEAEAVAGLRHPNVVQIHDVGDVDGRPYFTMEYVDGGSLAQKLTGTPQPPRHAAALVATLAGAMQVAHQGGIVHRDLKPANILLTANGTPKISDFGLARRLEGGARLTQSGVPLGTPSYMAPEQARGETHAIGPAVDVYALGAILYELLTGRPPFHGETPSETVLQVLQQDPVPPARLNTKVPRDLETICLKCLQKAPQHRYAAAQELAEDLGRYERGDPIAARPVSRSERIVRWVRRKPAAAVLILAAVLLIGLAVTSGVSKWRLETKRRAEIAVWTPKLEFVKQLQMNGRFQEARAVLQPLPDADIGELNDQIRVALAELDLAQRLGGIRLNRVAVVDGRFDLDANRARSDREYEAALGEAGITVFHDAPSVAARVRASPIRTALVAAMDDWALCTNDESRRRWIFEVARHADPDPSGWRDRVRDPILSQQALTKLAKAAVIQDESVQLLVALGQRMQAAGGDPIAFLRRVQQQYPGDFWANLTLADALWGKKPAECIRYYQAALAIRPEAAVAHHNVGRALALANRIEEALEHFREAIRLEPKYAHAVSNLGMALSIKGQNAEALELVKKAVALDERSARNHVNLGDVLDNLGRTEEAIAEYRRAITLDPDSWLAHNHLAAILMKSNHFDEALEHFECARRIEPTSGWPHLGIGALLQRRGRIDEAIAELEVAIRLDAELSRAHSLLGDCWREKHSPQKALLEYNKAIELRPDDANAIQARRAVMLQLGLGEAVRVEWANALKAGPPNHDAWYGYAELCLYLGHQGEYERACHELLGRFESSSDSRVCEQTGRACLLGIVGPEDTARAAALVERAVQARSPAWAYPYFLIAQGLARYRLGDFDGAVRSIQGDAARVHGPLPHLVLSMAHRRAGRMDEAFRSFATAMRIYDWSPSRVDSHDAWLYHTLRREAEPLLMPNLPALLAGQAKPRDQDERLALGAVCQSMQRPAMAARLFAEAFDAEPELANGLEAGYRYYAACCAARAGSGDGKDATDLSEEKRATWREQARVWLRDDLVAKRTLLAGAPSAERAALPGKLESWFKDPALACVRDDELLKLPSAEHEAWLALWRDARALLADAKSASSKTSR